MISVDKTNEYLIEKRLQKIDSQLHDRFRESIFVLRKLLSGYLRIFPDFTNHTESHSMTVLQYCNVLIGEENVNRLNEDELYTLMMSCFLHDIGMGLPEKDFREVCSLLGFDEDFDVQDPDVEAKLIRMHHHEFSATFIDKYATLFDIPSEEHIYAIKQICRGHRKNDLFDENEYPETLTVPSGNTICLPYLAAILRLADELDVTDNRNSTLIYDISKIYGERDIREFKKHMVVRNMIAARDEFTMHVKTDDEELFEIIVKLAGKLQETLDYCVKVVSQRTPYEITQKKVIIKRI